MFRMLRRRPPTEPDTEGSPAQRVRAAADPVDGEVRVGGTGKGRPTPKRRDAERARKARLRSAPKNRREAARMQRERMRADRMRVQEAMATGDDRYLPQRDKGPVRRFCRDFVDSRRTVSEFLLPFFVVLLIVMMIPTPTAQAITMYLWFVAIVLAPLDLILVARRLRRQLRERFPDQSHRGATRYALMRATQIRKMRLPKPQVKPGQAI